jgi:hypothetical protein
LKARPKSFNRIDRIQGLKQDLWARAAGGELNELCNISSFGDRNPDGLIRIIAGSVCIELCSESPRFAPDNVIEFWVPVSGTVEHLDADLSLPQGVCIIMQGPFYNKTQKTHHAISPPKLRADCKTLELLAYFVVRNIHGSIG